MNPERLLARLRALQSSLSTPQLISLAVAFVVVVVTVVGAAWWLGRPTYRVLFSDLDPESAAQVASRLRERKVSFELAEGGRTILVPDRQVDQLRLDFAATGLPGTGRMGFELFDTTNFGWTEFLEQVNYRRALEGELARTIATLEEVVSARVHIAMGQKQLFARERTGAKASVTLRLRGRRTLAPQTVAGIRNLVAFAIEDLRPEAVVVMDDRGRPLAVGGDDERLLGPAQLEAKAELESQIARNVGSMIEPLVGADRYRVQVAVQLTHDSEDVVAEQYGREGVLRSEERISEASTAGQLPLGIAGARANLPAPVPPAPSTAATTPEGAQPPAPPAASTTLSTGPGLQRLHERRNLELDKTITRTVRPPGGIARLSVAVLVDNAVEQSRDEQGNLVRVSKPRDPTFLQQVSELAARAAGLDTARGDVLTVQNLEFSGLAESLTPGEAEQAQPAPTAWWWGVAGSAAALVALGAAGLMWRRRRRRALAPAPQVETAVLPQHQLPRTIEEIEGEIEAQLEAEAARLAGDRRLPVLTRRLTGLVEQQPEAAARLVRTWLFEEKKA